MPLRYQKIKLSLYVTKENSGKSLAQLYKALEHHAYTDYEIRIVDVEQEALLAAGFGVTKIPTVQRHTKTEEIFYAGDLTDVEAVRGKLGFKRQRI